MERIEKGCSDRVLFNENRSKPYERKKMNISRKEVRKTYKVKQEGDYNEKKHKPYWLTHDAND